jgi:hypothetical protein
MFKSLIIVTIYLFLNSKIVLYAEEKCGESTHEDKKLAWTQLSKIEFQAQIPFKIPSGILCAGRNSKQEGQVEQVSYKSTEGSLRVFNRKFFLGTKRTVIKSDDFMETSLIKEALPILSFLINEASSYYSLNIEYINQLNPFETFNSKKQKYVSFELHLDKKQNALFYPKKRDKALDRIILEVDALFNIHTISLFNRQELISALKTQDL